MRPKFLRSPPAAPRLDLVKNALVEMAREQGYSPLIVQGLFEPELELYRVRSKAGAGERRFMTKADLDAEPDKWENEGQIKAPGQLLELTAAKAKDYGIARYVVDALIDLDDRISTQLDTEGVDHAA